MDMPETEIKYISITGLQLKSWWKVFSFYRYAIPAMAQAKASEGLIFADAKKINGVYHTVSVWQTKEHMLNYVHSGAHMNAITSFNQIATGKTFGYESREIPSWQEVHRRWHDEGVNYGND